MVKRIICILAISVFIAQSCFAQDIVFQDIKSEKHTPLGGVLFETEEVIEVAAEYSVSFFNDISFDEYIAGFVLDSEQLPEVISGLARFNITKDEFTDLYFDAVLKHPETLIRTKYTTIGIVEGTNIVESVEPIYLVDSKAAADEARQQMETAVKEYTDLANEYKTDVEKLIVIHDKMVADCKYDVNVLDESTADQAPHTVYHALGVFRDKKAVCQGYSQALYMIAKELEIELDFCMSDEKNHMWNFVKLDGKWYHMDMTNDDPLEVDEDGNKITREDTGAYHHYFLVSDEGLNTTVHGDDWRRFGGEVYDCNDTLYESGHLFNIVVPFTVKKGEDGFFHVPILIEHEEEGISTVVDFKNDSLRTGDAILGCCITDRKYTVTVADENVEKTDSCFYVMTYATKDIQNSKLIVRYDDADVILGILTASDISDNTVLITRVVEGIPADALPTFSSFLWNADTLAPTALKTVWSRQ